MEPLWHIHTWWVCVYVRCFRFILDRSLGWWAQITIYNSVHIRIRQTYRMGTSPSFDACICVCINVCVCLFGILTFACPYLVIMLINSSIIPTNHQTLKPIYGWLVCTHFGIIVCLFRNGKINVCDELESAILSHACILSTHIDVHVHIHIGNRHTLATHASTIHSYVNVYWWWCPSLARCTLYCEKLYIVQCTLTMDMRDVFEWKIHIFGRRRRCWRDSVGRLGNCFSSHHRSFYHISKWYCSHVCFMITAQQSVVPFREFLHEKLAWVREGFNVIAY